MDLFGSGKKRAAREQAARDAARHGAEAKTHAADQRKYAKEAKHRRDLLTSGRSQDRVADQTHADFCGAAAETYRREAEWRREAAARATKRALPWWRR